MVTWCKENGVTPLGALEGPADVVLEHSGDHDENSFGSPPCRSDARRDDVGRTGFAATYEVSSIAELQSHTDRALPGDAIVLRNGVYVTSAAITVNRPGTGTAPIRIVAKTIGGVTITGAQGFNVRAPAAHVQIIGFVFAHAAGTNHRPSLVTNH